MIFSAKNTSVFKSLNSTLKNIRTFNYYFISAGIPIVWLTEEKYLRSEMDSETSIAQENSSNDIPGSLVAEIPTSKSNQTLS